MGCGVLSEGKSHLRLSGTPVCVCVHACENVCDSAKGNTTHIQCALILILCMVRVYSCYVFRKEVARRDAAASGGARRACSGLHLFVSTPRARVTKQRRQKP